MIRPRMSESKYVSAGKLIIKLKSSKNASLYFSKTFVGQQRSNYNKSCKQHRHKALTTTTSSKVKHYSTNFKLRMGAKLPFCQGRPVRCPRSSKPWHRQLLPLSSHNTRLSAPTWSRKQWTVFRTPLARGLCRRSTPRTLQVPTPGPRWQWQPCNQYHHHER